MSKGRRFFHKDLIQLIMYLFSIVRSFWGKALKCNCVVPFSFEKDKMRVMISEE